MSKHKYDFLPEEYRPLSPWAYVGYSFLYAVPFVGFIFLVINSFRGSNVNRRNFTRSYFCIWMLILVIYVILALCGVGIPFFLDYLQK